MNTNTTTAVTAVAAELCRIAAVVPNTAYDPAVAALHETIRRDLASALNAGTLTLDEVVRIGAAITLKYGNTDAGVAVGATVAQALGIDFRATVQ